MCIVGRGKMTPASIGTGTFRRFFPQNLAFASNYRVLMMPASRGESGHRPRGEKLPRLRYLVSRRWQSDTTEVLNWCSPLCHDHPPPTMPSQCHGGSLWDGHTVARKHRGAINGEKRWKEHDAAIATCYMLTCYMLTCSNDECIRKIKKHRQNVTPNQ